VQYDWHEEKAETNQKKDVIRIISARCTETIKKKIYFNREQDGHGFVSPTDIEREILQIAKRKMGRAKKQKIDSHNI
jgi:hypothetical protein